MSYKKKKEDSTTASEETPEISVASDISTKSDSEIMPNNDKDNETSTEEIEILGILKAENTEIKEKLLRVIAEGENMRKRLARQKEENFKYRHQDILLDLSGIIDDFERAIESVEESKNFDAFYKGIQMIEKQFSGMLVERYNLERIGTQGEVFDPSAHEAMTLEESPDIVVETVKTVFQSGYRLHDRILRPAKVGIIKPKKLPLEKNIIDE